MWLVCRLTCSRRHSSSLFLCMLNLLYNIHKIFKRRATWLWTRSLNQIPKLIKWSEIYINIIKHQDTSLNIKIRWFGKLLKPPSNIRKSHELSNYIAKYLLITISIQRCRPRFLYLQLFEVFVKVLNAAISVYNIVKSCDLLNFIYARYVVKVFPSSSKIRSVAMNGRKENWLNRKKK